MVLPMLAGFFIGIIDSFDLLTFLRPSAGCQDTMENSICACVKNRHEFVSRADCFGTQMDGYDSSVLPQFVRRDRNTGAQNNMAHNGNSGSQAGVINP